MTLPRLPRALLPLLALMLASAACPPARAGELYKCGSTYSQTPCAPDAKTQKLHDAAPAGGGGSAGAATGYALCAREAPKHSGSPEPESAIVRPLGGRQFEVLKYAGQSIATHRFDLTIDAKTAYGVRSGPQPFSCWTSEDEARVLDFAAKR